MNAYPFHREIQTPVTADQLEPLDPRCQTVQFNSLLTDGDFQQLSKFMQQYPQVELRVYGNYDGKITNLAFLKHFPFIKQFSVEIWQLDNLDGLAFLPSDLESLGLGQTKSKRHSLRFLERFPALKTLYIEGHTKDFATIRHLECLEDLTLRSITLPDLSDLTALHQLKSLDIKLGGTTNLELLPRIGRLRYLELWLIRGLTDIAPVAEVESLQYLFLQALKRVSRIPSLHKLVELRRLHVQTMKGLTDLSPICTAPSLEELVISDMAHLQTAAFRPFISHPTLKAASIGIGSRKKNEAVRDMLNLPSVQGAFAFA